MVIPVLALLLPTQVLLHQLLVSWGPQGFEAFVKRLQRKYAQQALAAAAAAEQHLAAVAEWQPVTAGMFLWVKLTGGRCGGLVPRPVEFNALCLGHMLLLPTLAGGQSLAVNKGCVSSCVVLLVLSWLPAELLRTLMPELRCRWLCVKPAQTW